MNCPAVITNTLRVTSFARRCVGDSSPIMMGTTVEAMPIASPTTTRPGSRQGAEDDQGKIRGQANHLGLMNQIRLDHHNLMQSHIDHTLVTTDIPTIRTAGLLAAAMTTDPAMKSRSAIPRLGRRPRRSATLPPTADPTPAPITAPETMVSWIRASLLGLWIIPVRRSSRM